MLWETSIVPHRNFDLELMCVRIIEFRRTFVSDVECLKHILHVQHHDVMGDERQMTRKEEKTGNYIRHRGKNENGK